MTATDTASTRAFALPTSATRSMASSRPQLFVATFADRHNKRIGVKSAAAKRGIVKRTAAKRS
jgi:hypothetical protein